MTSGKRIVSIIDQQPEDFRKAILSQTESKDYILLDNWELQTQNIEWIIGWGQLDKFVYSADTPDQFPFLDQWLDQHQDWKFGYFNYDLKNTLEPSLVQKVKQSPKAPYIYLFVPEIVFIATNGHVEAHHYSGQTLPTFSESIQHPVHQKLDFAADISPEEYCTTIDFLKQQIRNGEFYEINYCMEWTSKDIFPHPAQAYQHLQSQLQAPFSCYFQLDGIHLMCNSPERFLKKTGQQLISQPIKGTSSRFADQVKDDQSKSDLQNEKNTSENIMIVDLVRNDLSKIAEKGSVHVSELTQIYTFPQVHQLISTIVCTLKEDTSFTDILKATFPMGSMTGAPKISAMNYAENTELMHRDIYSGTVGYFTPDGDFDFNVVIRSVLHYTFSQTTHIRAGGAITIDSIPDQEWEECQLKAAKLLQAFQ